MISEATINKKKQKFEKKRKKKGNSITALQRRINARITLFEISIEAKIKKKKRERVHGKIQRDQKKKREIKKTIDFRNKAKRAKNEKDER